MSSRPRIIVLMLVCVGTFEIVSCATPQCNNRHPCGPGQYCQSGRCETHPLCKERCAPNTECTVSNNLEVKCTCKVDHMGDAYKPLGSTYNQVPPPQAYGCSPVNMSMCWAHTECGVYQYCKDGECVRNPPCSVNKCGPNTFCEVSYDNHPICSCKPGYTGKAQQGCYPISACSSDSECGSSEFCSSGGCVHACTTMPGCVTHRNATCESYGHGAVCKCNSGYVPIHAGAPEHGCLLRTPPAQQYPCLTTSCGPFSQCTVSAGRPSCSCLPGYIGQPPNCFKPHCRNDNACSSSLACYNGKCQNPCIGMTCGQNAVCYVDMPLCICQQGYARDPANLCQIIPPTLKGCEASPCGSNSWCKEENGQAVCYCLPGYEGDPTRHCHAIPSTVSPCGQIRCGTNSQCRDENGQAVCYCPQGYTGDPNRICQVIPPTVNPCVPPSCGPNSQCSVQNGAAVCTCEPGYISDAHTSRCTRPECTLSAECASNQACVDHKCVDPCDGKGCGLNAHCQVIEHSPVCSCDDGFAGTPLSGCYRIPTAPECDSQRKCKAGQYCNGGKCVPHPCNVKQCGPNTQCTVDSNHAAVCRCKDNYIGDAADISQGCQPKPECLNDSDCGVDRICTEEKCVRKPTREELCKASCGVHTKCSVVHGINVLCGCEPGFTGNPYDRNKGCHYANGELNSAMCGSEDKQDQLSPECERFFKERPQKQFFIVLQESSWFEAHTLYESEGRMLAMVENSRDRETLENMLVVQGLSNDRFWLAGSDLKTQDRFQWVVGNTFNTLGFTNWAVSEPSGRDQHCVAMTTRFFWVTEHCSQRYAFICQNK